MMCGRMKISQMRYILEIVLFKFHFWLQDKTFIELICISVAKYIFYHQSYEDMKFEQQ